MRYQALAALFLLSSVAMTATVYLDDKVFFGMAMLFVCSGLALTLMMFDRMYVYLAILFGFHISMAGFTAWVYLNRQYVVPESVFVFSTLTESNLQWAIIVLEVSCLAIFFPTILFLNHSESMWGASMQSLGMRLVGGFDRLPLALFRLAILLSFSSAILFFSTNTSVLDASYPTQIQGQWVAGALLKAPTFAAVGALAFAYVRRLLHVHTDSNYLFVAKINFLFVSIIMLLLTGSRGMFTFLWLGIGLFDLLLWTKRRGLFFWGLLFVALAWFAFQSWPYMRFYLAINSWQEVLGRAFWIGVGLGDDAELVYRGQQQIRLGDITMIGQSLYHLLYAVQLIKDGISLSGLTFINLIPQALPEFLDGVLWDRPLNDNYRLMEYYHHGGGFLILANVYWNGGLAVVGPFFAALSTIFIVFDKHLVKASTGVIYRAVYWLWIPIMIVQLGYGVQGEFRVVQLLIVALFFDKWHRNFRRQNKAGANLKMTHPTSVKRS